MLIPLEDAQATVLAGCRPLEPHRIAWSEVGLGQVLAADVIAEQPVPPFPNTAMDGYAVRAADVAEVPVLLPVVAEVGAGHPAQRPLQAGEAMRIFTGAPIPEGADAVVMVEHTERLDGGSGARVEIRQSVPPGTHVRPPGDDFQPGDVVVRARDPLTPGRLGALRTVGAGQLLVHPRPRVGVMSTGDELVQSGPLGPGQIYDSNRPTLLALAGAAGAEPIDLGHAGDDETAITATLSAGVARCDLVLSTGGVSMGDTDLVKVVLDRMAGPGGSEGPGAAAAAAGGVGAAPTAGAAPAGGAAGSTGTRAPSGREAPVPQGMRWMQVAIKPGKPLAFGVVPSLTGSGSRTGTGGTGTGVPVLGLPGNPVSSMVSFELFARPAIRRLAGHPDDRLHRPRLAGRADEPLTRRPDGKVQFVRAMARVVEGELRVRSAGGQGSHQLSAMARANALVVLPDGSGVAAGEPVEVMLLTEI